jgi:hypothetical protein
MDRLDGPGVLRGEAGEVVAISSHPLSSLDCGYISKNCTKRKNSFAPVSGLAASSELLNVSESQFDINCQCVRHHHPMATVIFLFQFELSGVQQVTYLSGLA